MPLYSYQSLRSLPRLLNKTVAVDSSYIIALSDDTDHHHNAILAFHLQAIQNGTKFLTNITIRQEFATRIRKRILCNAILAAQIANPSLATRYQTISGFTNKPLSASNVGNTQEKIYKAHIRAGDIGLLLSHVTQNIWSEFSNLSRKP